MDSADARRSESQLVVSLLPHTDSQLKLVSVCFSVFVLFLGFLGAVNNPVDALLDVGHLLQHLVDSGLVKLQTYELRVLRMERRSKTFYFH